ncbi:MAG TPA: AtpZ/AtpI family protein [Candidatus Saccharimonadales bacterium]|nr:AtpZ/AtpI family protein [Candidatus Saccharimonadales bacterium]
MGKDSVEPNKTASINSVFFAMGLDMSWRLALSVLVPIIGGVYLDKAFHTAPVLLIVGFALAILMTVVTIRRTLNLTKELPFVKHPLPHKDYKDDDD